MKLWEKVLRNKSLWLAILALLQTLALNYWGIDKEVWLAIDGILVVLIGSLAVEEGARSIRIALNDAVIQLRKLNK